MHWTYLELWSTCMPTASFIVIWSQVCQFYFFSYIFVSFSWAALSFDSVLTLCAWTARLLNLTNGWNLVQLIIYFCCTCHICFSGNLLLTEDKKQVKLADFGLAREEVMDEMTCEAGTYRWMAPEVVFLVSEICTAKNLDATFNSFSYLN